jgi:hypothetical protein
VFRRHACSCFVVVVVVVIVVVDDDDDVDDHDVATCSDCLDGRASSNEIFLPFVIFCSPLSMSFSVSVSGFFASFLRAQRDHRRRQGKIHQVIEQFNERASGSSRTNAGRSLPRGLARSGTLLFHHHHHHHHHLLSLLSVLSLIHMHAHMKYCFVG